MAQDKNANTRVQVLDNEGLDVSLFPSQEKLKNFVSSLLGESQTISKWFDGNFDINAENVKQLNEIIQQRLKQQNEGSIISFIAKTTYDDNTTITQNNIDDFLSYNEIGPLIPTSLSLTWVLLVHFPDKDGPEKQKIDISFQRSPNNKVRISSGRTSIPFFYGAPPATLRIEHTARTWGADIEAMLSKYLELIVKKEKGFRCFVRRHDGKFSLFTFLLILVGSSLGALKHSKDFIQKNIDMAEEISKLPTDKYEFVAQRVDYLIGLIASGTWSMHIYYLMLYGLIVLVIASFSSFFVGNYAEKQSPSFITLTEKSKEDRQMLLSKHSRDWVMLFVSLLLGLIASVFANFIYSFVIS